jgi:hypothetical protein
MSWFSILKTDADFDFYLGDKFGQYDTALDEILVNPTSIYAYLKKKLKREPTDKEITEFIKRTLMHEGGHAGHFKTQPSDFGKDRNIQRLEGVAYRLQFPESLYLAIVNLVKHPASFNRDSYNTVSWLGKYLEKANTKELKSLIRWVNNLAPDLESREKILRLEIRQRKADKFKRKLLPNRADQAIAIYGRKHKKFLESLNW